MEEVITHSRQIYDRMLPDLGYRKYPIPSKERAEEVIHCVENGSTSLAITLMAMYKRCPDPETEEQADVIDMIYEAVERLFV